LTYIRGFFIFGVFLAADPVDGSIVKLQVLLQLTIGIFGFNDVFENILEM